MHQQQRDWDRPLSSKKRRKRMRPISTDTSCMIVPSLTKILQRGNVSRIAILCIMVSSPFCKTEAFITPQLYQRQHKTYNILDNTNQQITQIPIKTINRPRSSSASSTTTTHTLYASAWLFAPDKISGVLADTATEALTNTANAATDAALEVAAHAVDIATTVTTDTVVQTIYKAPFISLAISFLLGGLFFSTVAAVIASIIALGKENTRRLREVIGIVYRRNWTVMKISMQFTMVS